MNAVTKLKSKAFEIFQNAFGVAKLLDAEDLISIEKPDERSIITYLSTIYDKCPTVLQPRPPLGNVTDTTVYKDLSGALKWIREKIEEISEFEIKIEKNTSSEAPYLVPQIELENLLVIFSATYGQDS